MGWSWGTSSSEARRIGEEWEFKPFHRTSLVWQVGMIAVCAHPPHPRMAAKCTDYDVDDGSDWFKENAGMDE